MNKCLFIVLILWSTLFSYNNSCAQSTTKTYYNKVDSIDIGINCFKQGNDSLAISYLKPLLQDSTQLDIQQLTKVKLAMQLYYANHNLSEYSLYETESLIKQYNNDDSLKIAALHILSYDLIDENKNSEAIKYIKDALAINDTSSSIYYIPLLLSQAHAYEILEKYQEVVETFNLILQTKDIKENYYYIGTLQNAARYYNRVGYVEEAIKHIKKAIKAIDKSNYDKHAELLSDLARFYYDSNKKDKGIKLQEEVIEIRKSNFKNDNDKEKLTTSLSNLIYYYDHNNDSINSFNTKHELIDNDYPLNSRRTYFYAYELSYHYYEKENIEKAVHYGIKAVELFEKNKEEYINDYISLVCYLRDIYLEINEYEQAIIYQKKYINTFTDKNSEYATAIALLAEYYTKNIENEANIRLALELLKEAANIRLELEGITSDSFIRTQLNIANHLMTLGQYNESIKYLESCLSNLDSNSDRYILCLKFMATAYARLKNNNKAIELFQGMQEKAIERKDTLTYLESIVEIAEYDSNLKNLNNNIEKCQYVINTIENVKSSNNRILELYNNAIDALGNLYIRYGNHKQASICFEKSLKNTEFKEGKNSFNYLGHGTQLLNCYTYTDIKKADSLSLLLLDIAHNMSNNSYLAHLNNRSVILSIMKRHEEAIKCLKEVRDSYRIIYGVNSPIYATVCHNIGIDYSSIRKDSIAINYFNEALRIRKIHENSNPFEYLETLYSIITSKMSMNIDCKNDAEYYLSKCILLLSDIKFMSSEQRFLFHKSFNKKSLDYIVFNNIEDTELLYNYILFSKELLLELDINNDINRQLYTWNHLKQKMREDDIAIEFINYPKDEQANLWQYDALIIKKDYEIPKRIRLFEIDNNDNDFIDIMAENICKIWDKLLFDFSEKDNIYFTPIDVLYNYYPIESLLVNNEKFLKQDKWIIMSDVYNMHRLSSTRELVKEKKEMKYTKAALYGGLNYDMTDSELLAENQTYSKNATEEYFVSRGLLEDSIRGYKWDKLSNTLQEVDYISDLMKKNQITTQTYKGNKGNEESFKALSGHEYNIIHLATHGFFYPDEEAKEKDYFKPMLLNDNYRMYNEVDMSMWRSGLVMSGGNRAWKGDTIPDMVEDGILKAQEIGDLDLRGADLVVLSACNTGQGEVTGEGVFGLQRAFKMAGAQTIVMSLTPVDDQTTMAMMNKFYTNLFSGQSKHDAFYNAQRYIRSIKPDPKYWMGWIMLD